MLPHYQLLFAAATLLLTRLPTITAAIIVTGVPVASTAPTVPPRQNIVDLYAKGGPQWDLYIQALASMQATDMTDPESYFQISAIHGAPAMEYDNTGPRKTGGGWGGYCPHGELLFLTWHRPYVVLFEQVLVKRAKEIAMKYPEEHRPTYIEAADSLRSPFWDWAMDGRVPDSTVPQTLKITVAENGKLTAKDVENPLKTFNIPQAVVDGQFGEFDSEHRNRVYRCNQENMTYPETANEFLQRGNYKARMVAHVFALL
ncbi:putative domain, di-copper centre [Cordyceps fumosorosea ARSEF 2679]|uniref:Putative domain, di-copper centre n=1 Tax=Cordyceps fumosorosea (strain ARSEF 2679) TaxID=1081104 RepID=A0A167WIY3_CORFA|nr:putative domain, di-copper centre [Cordyceps fumosorosea ARSEF 2679]OAA63847.1 putative domain, di-copper centre [Cordyceps fumosorosea ARSEF 2679]